MRRIIVLTSLVVLVTAGAALASDRFPDVSDDNAHHDNISWAAEQGIVRGHADGTFRPNDGLRRGQAASMFAQYEEHRQEQLEAAIDRAWTGPVYRMSPIFPESGEPAGTCEFVVVDQNNVGSGSATVEYTVDGAPPVQILDEDGMTQEIPEEGFLAFEVDAEGMVSVLVDSVAQAHAHTVEGCVPAS